MAISVTHAHVSTIEDNPAYDVSSSEWNAAHTVTGVAAYEAGCDKGTSFPASSVAGQMYYRTDRKTLYQYENSIWNPVQSFAALTLYVDPNGTDDSTHGFGSGADAFKTINYALGQVPPLYGGNVTINIAAGTYTENVEVRGKQPSGPYTLSLIGTLTSVLDTTMTSGVQGTLQGSTQAEVTKAGAGWTTNAYKYMLCKFTSGTNNGLYRIIEKNDAAKITLVGHILAAAPANGDSFSVFDFGAIIAGTLKTYSACSISGLRITGATYIRGPIAPLRCRFCNLIFEEQAGSQSFDLCIIESSSGHTCMVESHAGRLYFAQCFFSNSANSTITLLVRQAIYAMLVSCVLDNNGVGSPMGMICCFGSGEAWFGVVEEMKTILKNTNQVALHAEMGGHFCGKTKCAFVSVTTQSSAESATYSTVT